MTAFGGLIEAGDAVEDGGLACAVRADDGGDLATPRGEREPVDGDKAAEAHGEMLDAQDLVLLRWRTRPSAAPFLDEARRKWFAPPATMADGVRPAISPRGRQSMTTTMDSPKISMR